MFLHSPPWQLPWESLHSSTSAGSQGSKAAYGSTSQGQEPMGSSPEGLSPAGGVWTQTGIGPLCSSTASGEQHDCSAFCWASPANHTVSPGTLSLCPQPQPRAAQPAALVMAESSDFTEKQRED